MDPLPPQSFPPPTDAQPPYPPPYISLPPTILPAPPGPPRVWTVFVAFFAGFLVGSFVAGLVAVVIAVATNGPEVVQKQDQLEAAMMRPPAFLSMMFATQVVLAGVALCGGLLSPTPIRQRLRIGAPRLPWYGYPVFAVGTIVLGYTGSIVIELLGLGDKGVLQEFEKAMAGLRGPVLLVATLVIGLSPALGEELLFRGYIQTRLRQRWHRMVAVPVASVLFGIIHFDWVQGSFAVFLGLWLGEITDRTGSVWPAVVGHAVNNAGATVMGALMGTDASSVTSSPGWELAVSVPLFLLCLLYLLRRPVVPVGPVSPAPPMPSVDPTLPAAPLV